MIFSMLCVKERGVGGWVGGGARLGEREGGK